MTIPADAAMLRDVADDYNERWCEMGGTSAENVAARGRIGVVELRIRALAGALPALIDGLTWMASFDRAYLDGCATLHYDMNGKAKELLALLCPPPVNP